MADFIYHSFLDEYQSRLSVSKFLIHFHFSLIILFTVGNPIDVEKTQKPTQEQIDELHGKFVKSLEEIFEKHKHKYLANPDKTFLEYV